jgi:hypothetical protein
MLAKDNGESITSTLGCRHLSVIEYLIEQFIDNFSNVSKEKKVTKSKTMEKDELLINGMVLIVLSNKFKTKDGLACNEKDEYEMAIVVDCNIQEFFKKKCISI